MNKKGLRIEEVPILTMNHTLLVRHWFFDGSIFMRISVARRWMIEHR
jgi:hypothetical protein